MQNQRTYLQPLRQTARLLLLVLVIVVSVAFLWVITGATDTPILLSLPSENQAVSLSESVAISTTLEEEASWLSNESNFSRSVAWGDVDADGDLDLAVGNYEQANKLYESEDGILTLRAMWLSLESDATVSVAWGDVDADGDLDLAVGNQNQPNKLYLNEGGTLTEGASWQNETSDDTQSVAWGDVDADGDLDLAVGNANQPNKLYLNEGGMLTEDASWQSLESDSTVSVAWGDVDADGDLDLAVGNGSQPNKLYLNEGGALTEGASWQSLESDNTESVAWGDVDADGDLDLAVSNVRQPNKLYLNEGTMLTEGAGWQSDDSDDTSSVAWGDVDADGDLDLAVSNAGQANKLYLNEGTMLSTSASWESEESNITSSVAWGDMDADGDLDLAISNQDQPNKLYKNEAKTLSASWQSLESNHTQSVAWGDVDADGDLDLAVGNDPQTNKLYLNEGGILNPSWQSLESDRSQSVAWGDVDADGDLDLAIGNQDQPNKLYLNQGGMLNTSASWQSEDDDSTRSVAWGDVDADGDLDLVVGNRGQPNKLYLNEGGILSVSWQSLESNATESVAWGDVDADGDLDLVVGNYQQPNKLYLNEGGMLNTSATWESLESDRSQSVAWGDVDGDGDLDLAVGNANQPIKLYEGEDGMLSESATAQSDNSDLTQSVAWGDVDGDGDLDLAVGNYSGLSKLYINESGRLVLQSELEGSITSLAWGDMDADGDLDLAVGKGQQPNQLYLNQRPAHPLHPNQSVVMAINTLAYAPANFYALPEIQEGVIPITYTLSNPAGNPMREVRAFYSPDGGGRWLEAVATSDTITTNLSSNGDQHLYHWDVLASGFFGQSHNMVFRLEGLPTLAPITDSIPGPFQRPLVSAHTYPGRVRGSQVQVYTNTIALGNELADALVYRLPVGETTGAEPYTNNAGEFFSSDTQGYLQGRGELAIGDRLIALLPITTTESYTLYHTSAAPTETGLESHLVQETGVQELVVSADNPLLLFDLELSLEWDARNDSTFLTNLEEAIELASDVLYDVSNGQVAIGEIQIYQAKENWLASNIVMYAANNIRPRANLGGIVSSSTDDEGLTGQIEEAYLPGQVLMGPNWDPFGEDYSDLGQDWWRALAHELAHYLLFLPDNYIGIGQNGNLISLDCQGSFMTNTHDDDYSEFLTDAEWVGDCQETIAAYTTGRPDWETISTFYPMISDMGTNSGPSTRPLDVTKVTFIELETDTTLASRYFDLRDSESSALLPLPEALGYLLKTQGTTDLTDDMVVPLGTTAANGDRIKVRGAEIDDRLCLFDSSSSRLGCETVTESNVSVALSEVLDWQPEILVTPVTSRTFAITVTQLIETDALNVQVLPAYGSSVTPTLISAPWDEMIPVDSTSPLTFTQVITLPYPAFEAFVRVWQPDSVSEREAISQFYLSAAWGPPSRSGKRNTPGLDANASAWDANTRAWATNTRSWGAPVASGDGQITIFNTSDPFGETDISALQALTTLPNLSSWLTEVGQGYRVSLYSVDSDGQDNTTESITRTISFDYLQRDVPSGYEHTLNIYYLPDNGETWQRLATDLDIDENQAASLMPAEGAGTYALLSTIDVELPSAGWNLFAYPVQTTRPVTEALQSISGYYTTVYGYEGSDTTDPWKLYDVTVPDWVNDLDELVYGRGYWLNVSQPITLGLPVDTDTQLARIHTPPSPPATYYGIIEGDGQSVSRQTHSVTGFQPQAGLSVTAWIGDALCGRGQTQRVDGQVVYALDVWAEGQKAGCGAAGRVISFQVGEQRMGTTARWDNSRVWEQALSSTHRLYMPLVRQVRE